MLCLPGAQHLCLFVCSLNVRFVRSVAICDVEVYFGVSQRVAVLCDVLQCVLVWFNM